MIILEKLELQGPGATPQDSLTQINAATPIEVSYLVLPGKLILGR